MADQEKSPEDMLEYVSISRKIAGTERTLQELPPPEQAMFVMSLFVSLIMRNSEGYQDAVERSELIANDMKGVISQNYHYLNELTSQK